MKANMSKRSRALIIGGAVALALLVTTVVLYNKGSLFKFPGLAPASDSLYHYTVHSREHESTTVLYPNQEKVALYSNSSAPEFIYELQPSYGSRAEVLQEMEDLSACFKCYCDGKSSGVVYQAQMKYYTQLKTLTEYHDAFPTTEDELIQSKKRVYQTYLDFREQELIIAARCLEMDPTDTENYALRKAEYEEGLKIDAKYNSGEITLDEALALLGVDYESIVERRNQEMNNFLSER